MSSSLEKDMSAPSQNVIHGALILVQVLFGTCSVVGALGLPATNPLTFSLYREVCAGFLLLVGSIMINNNISYKQVLSFIFRSNNNNKVVPNNKGMTGTTTTTKSTMSSSTSMQTTTTSMTSSLGIDSNLLLNNNDEENDKNDVTKLSSTGKMKIDPWYMPFMRNYKNFAILGLAIFGNQAGYIVGIKLAGPVAASVWQPSQPLITTAISMTMGWEVFNKRRLLGVIIAFFGCAGMVILSVHAKKQQQELLEDSLSTQQQTTATTGDDDDDTTNTTSPVRYLAGNLLFLINCSCCSAYILYSKNLLKLYPSLTVTAWSYNMAAFYMFFGVLLSSIFTKFDTFLCPECQRNASFTLPSGAFPALIYFIIFGSTVTYGLMTWANQHVTGTLVTGYTVLQPVTSVLLTGMLLLFHVVASCKAIITATIEDTNNVVSESTSTTTALCLDPPALSTFCGMAGVFTGLAIIITTEPKSTTKRLTSSSSSTVNTTSSMDGDNDDDEEGLETIPLVSNME